LNESQFPKAVRETEILQSKIRAWGRVNGPERAEVRPPESALATDDPRGCACAAAPSPTSRVAAGLLSRKVTGEVFWIASSDASGRGIDFRGAAVEVAGDFVGGPDHRA